MSYETQRPNPTSPQITPFPQTNLQSKIHRHLRSYPREKQTEKSDIDLLIEFEAPVGFFKFIELEERSSEKHGAKVDIVTPDALKPLIKTSGNGGGWLCLKREFRLEMRLVSYP